jgi:hypothetical protein
MDYPKSPHPLLELRQLHRTEDYSIILNEPPTPKIPYSYFSDIDLGENPVTERSRTQLRQTGHIRTAFLVSYALLLASVISSLTTIIAFILTRQYSTNASIYPQSFPVFKDTCDSKKLQFNNLFAHFFVNVIGTVILGLSNYIQQMCASPNIEDVSKGLQRRGDIQFGSNSPTAVFRIGQRVLSIAWVALILTSLPLHLTLNGITGFAAKSIPANRTALTTSQIVELTPTELSWDNVSSQACASLLIGSRAHVVNFVNITIIINDGLPADAVSYYNGSGESYYANPSDIVNCYVEMVLSECELTVRWFPLLGTSFAIIAKTVIVWILIRRHSHFQKPQFSTLGDMIYLATRHPELRRFLPDAGPPRGAVFEGVYGRRRIPWRKALGVLDTVAACFWWITAIAVTTIGTYLWYSVAGGLSLSDRMKRFGLGTEDPATSLVSGTTGRPFQEGVSFPVQVIMANLPQVWSTIAYLTWNNQITRIWLEKEWRSFYRSHQRPRVSINSREPGIQSARWLQLPYWVTALLMSISVLLHWLVSQTLFVVEIYFSEATLASVFHLHFSPLALISVGTMAMVLVFGITFYYFIPIRTWMPLMAGSTRVVFDSCFQLPNTGLPRSGIGWGDISTTNERVAGFGGVVARMVEGVKYPGLTREEPQAFLSDYPYVTEFDTEPLVRRYK